MWVGVRDEVSETLQGWGEMSREKKGEGRRGDESVMWV